MIERVEQRVLGALSLIDQVTRMPLTRPLRLRADQLTLRRNASGDYVIVWAAGLESHLAAFQQPPPDPLPGSLEYRLEIDDPLGRYLPRSVAVRLPRQPDPAAAGSEDSLFRAQAVALYPTATARLFPNWSTIRVTVRRGEEPQNAVPVRGALLRVFTEADSRLLASGISDRRGEALVIVPGVPLTQFADQEDDGGEEDTPVVVNNLPVRLELSVDAADPWPVDPELLEANHAANRRLSMPLTLSTGKMEKVVTNIT